MKLENIALVGFMGAGKSAVGRSVAGALGFEFVDTDEMIELRAGKSIGRIFTEDGERVFRQWERQVLEELSGRRKQLIATGGGLITQPGNLEKLQEFALVVCLWASAETLWRRVKNQRHRPLLNTEDPERTIRELLAEREPFYRRAHILVNSDRRSIRQVAQQIIYQYRMECEP